MISFEEFKRIYAIMPGEPEFELYFRHRAETYMIIKYDDCVSFQRCGYIGENDEADYRSLDALYAADLIDGIKLGKDWNEIEEIETDSTWLLSKDDDVWDIEERYGSR